MALIFTQNDKTFRTFVDKIQTMMDEDESGEALYMTEMMVTSLKKAGDDWAKFRVPICGLLFGAFQFRADEYDTTVVKEEAMNELRTFEGSPCIRVNDKEFIEVLGEQKRQAIQTARDAFVCISFPRRCQRSAAKLIKDSTSQIGINREPRRGRTKRESDVVDEACFENDEILPPELDEDGVSYARCKDTKIHCS